MLHPRHQRLCVLEWNDLVAVPPEERDPWKLPRQLLEPVEQLQLLSPPVDRSANGSGEGAPGSGHRVHPAHEGYVLGVRTWQERREGQPRTWGDERL